MLNNKVFQIANLPEPTISFNCAVNSDVQFAIHEMQDETVVLSISCGLQIMAVKLDNNRVMMGNYGIEGKS